jgi:hypothetical protein
VRRHINQFTDFSGYKQALGRWGRFIMKAPRKRRRGIQHERQLTAPAFLDEFLDVQPTQGVVLLDLANGCCRLGPTHRRDAQRYKARRDGLFEHLIESLIDKGLDGDPKLLGALDQLLRDFDGQFHESPDLRVLRGLQYTSESCRPSF